MTVKQHILDEITSGGPIPFERFMKVALYSPGGFFAGDTLRSVRAGDDDWVEVQIAARRWLVDVLARVEAGAVSVLGQGFDFDRRPIGSRVS